MKNVLVKVKKFSNKAVIPDFKTEQAAGADVVGVWAEIYVLGPRKPKLYSTCTNNEDLVEDLIFLRKKEEPFYIKYYLDLGFELPLGFCIKGLPRSSVWETGMILANSEALIDADYRGNVSLMYRCDQYSAPYLLGFRVGQIVIEETLNVEFNEVKELSSTERGSGGYGHTGK